MPTGGRGRSRSSQGMRPKAVDRTANAQVRIVTGSVLSGRNRAKEKPASPEWALAPRALRQRLQSPQTICKGSGSGQLLARRSLARRAGAASSSSSALFVATARCTGPEQRRAHFNTQRNRTGPSRPVSGGRCACLRVISAGRARSRAGPSRVCGSAGPRDEGSWHAASRSAWSAREVTGVRLC